MLKLLCRLPRKISLGFSCGVDSVATAVFLSRNHEVKLIYVDHGDRSPSEQDFASDFAEKHSLEIDFYVPHKLDLVGKSKEHVWSQARHDIFNCQRNMVVTAHHLNDVMETWIVSSLQGKPKIMNLYAGNVVRPFLSTPKQKLVEFATRKKLEWVEDETNLDSSFAQRNYVRNILIPHALVVNPGLEKTVKKLVENEYDKR